MERLLWNLNENHHFSYGFLSYLLQHHKTQANLEKDTITDPYWGLRIFF